MSTAPVVTASEEAAGVPADAIRDRRGWLGAGLRRIGSQARLTLQAASDLLMPPVCVACHRPAAAHDALCPDCWSRVDFIGPPLCDALGLPLPFDTGGPMISAAAAANPPVYRRARAVARYDGAMRRLVHGLKFHDQHHGRRLFGAWLTRAGAELIAEADVVVPVPLYRLRLAARRFNQSAILAQEVARRAGLPYRPLALERHRRTASQVGLTHDERQRNVRGAFRVPVRRQGEVAGKRVLLIDDVVTTGATGNACARALLAAGAAQVEVLALALVTDSTRMST